MNKSKFVALVLGLAVSASAFADNTGFFIGGAVGKAEAMKADACLDPSIPCDRQDTTWTGSTGFMFTPNWGAEVGYHYLGRVVDQSDGATMSSFAKVRAVDAVVIGALPIQNFSLYLKAGAYRAKTDLTSSYLPEGSNKNNQWTYGGGIRWDIFKHLALRAEIQRFNNVGGGAVGFRADVRTYTGGVLLTF